MGSASLSCLEGTVSSRHPVPLSLTTFPPYLQGGSLSLTHIWDCVIAVSAGLGHPIITYSLDFD